MKAWREHRKLTQKQLSQRMSVESMTVSRWERSTRQLTTATLDQLADVLSIETIDLYRLPATPSADALLRGQPEAIKRQAIAIIETLKKAS